MNMDLIGKTSRKDARTGPSSITKNSFSLWKDADPGLPEVDDAKKRLAGLRGE